jgi:hypothetical protein
MSDDSKLETVRSIVEEYTNNLVEGCTTEGDFVLATFHEKHLKQLTERIRKVGWMCSFVNSQSNNYCTVRYQPYDEWFEHPLDF